MSPEAFIEELKFALSKDNPLIRERLILESLEYVEEVLEQAPENFLLWQLSTKAVLVLTSESKEESLRIAAVIIDYLRPLHPAEDLDPKLLETLETLSYFDHDGITDGYSQFSVGLWLARMPNVVAHKKEAATWYRLAASQGEAKAQYALGVMLETGDGIEKDEQAAINWYTEAAESLPEARKRLDEMIRDGRGVRQLEVLTTREESDLHAKPEPQTTERNADSHQISEGDSIPTTQAVSLLLEEGRLDEAIVLVDQLLQANPESEELGDLRVRMEILRLRLNLPEADEQETRARLRVHFTQLTQIDQIHWAFIEQRGWKLLNNSSTSVPVDDLADLLEQVRTFQAEHPNFLDGWLLQATLALLLERPQEGISAGSNLHQLHAFESTNPHVITLLKELDGKGWWLRQQPTNQEEDPKTRP